MPIYMTPPSPDEFDPNAIPNPQGPSAEASVDYFHKGQQGASVDYFHKGQQGAAVDYFVKGEQGANVDYFHKAESPEGWSWGEREAGPGGGPHARSGIIGPERRRSGALGILIGLLVFSLAGILIGLLVFIFAPTEFAGSAAGILIGDQAPGALCTVPEETDLTGVIAILVGLDGVRTSMGSDSFFQAECSQPTEVQAEPPPSPTNVPGTDPTKTPIPANNANNPTTSGGGGDQPNQPTDPCLPNNGGMASYEPNYCQCNGTTSTIIFCQDGTLIETVNAGGSCQPDPALCQQPPTDGGGQQPPPPPACEYKCYVSDPNKPEQCMQGGWVYPGTDNACDPNNP